MELPITDVAVAALAQELRLDILRLLVRAGRDELPAGQIGKRLGLPSVTLSFHMSQLKHARLVKFRREGRSLIYADEYLTMNEPLVSLTENWCRGASVASSTEVCGPPHIC